MINLYNIYRHTVEHKFYGLGINHLDRKNLQNFMNKCNELSLKIPEKIYV